MIEQLGLKPDIIVKFLLVLLRISIVFMVLPVFGSKSLPVQFKIGLIVGITLILTPIVDIKIATNDIIMLVIRESLFSVVLGLTVRVLFFAIDAAGQVISTTAGMSMANVFNPEIGQSTEISRFYSIVAVLLFFASNMHHYFIYALVKSFEYVPIGKSDTSSIVQAGIKLGAEVFILAVKLAAPVITIVMITNILMGILYKLIPQFNIFFVAYPLYLTLGFLVILFSIPVVFILISNYFVEMKNNFNHLLIIGGTK